MQGCRMGKFGEGPGNVGGHRNVNIALGIVPVEGEATVELASPVKGEFIVGVDGVDEVLSIGFGKIFDAKIVNTKCESGAFGLVAP